jgi:tetratricopeptide (TPR) repeat protein
MGEVELYRAGMNTTIGGIIPVVARAMLRIGAVWVFAAATILAQTNAEALARMKTGSAFLQRGEVEAAVKELKAAVAAQPESGAAHMLLGQAYLAQRALSMIAEAKAEFQQALDLDPTLFWARFYLARVYMDLGRYDKAKQELEQGLKERPNVPHFLGLLGEVNRKLGHPEISLQLNQKALDVDPEMSPAAYYMALAYMDMKKDDEAIRELEAATQSKYVAPDMCFTLGSQYLKRKRYKQAEAIVRKGIQLDPSRSEGHLNLAQLANVQGEGDKALAELKLAMPPGKSFPTSPYYQQLQADIHYERGRAYQIKGRMGEAIDAYMASLDLDPNRPETHRRLAEIYNAQGDPTRAGQHNAMADKLAGAKRP